MNTDIRRVVANAEAAGNERNAAMNPRSLTLVSAIGLALSVAMTPAAFALSLNPKGTGQVLIFPYYTVSAGNQTLISVVNATDRGKAIKLRFREGRNARAALSLNLYLSPFDVWTASAFSLSDSGPSNPANLISNDNSCTVPRIQGNSALPALANGRRYMPFQNTAFTGASNDAGPDSLDRTREGYFEMIDMGSVDDIDHNSGSALWHTSNGVPANCLQIERAWLPADTLPAGSAYWTANALIDMHPPQGGLIGVASIVDALDGTMLTYNAEAIDGFSDIVQHTAPDATLPTLASARSNADSATAQVFDNGALITSTYPAARAVDAVSALFMQDEIFNEFVTSPSVGGASEWVVTLPTKFAYTDEAIVGAAPIPPFTRVFPITASSANDGKASVDMRRETFNREEGPNAAFCDHPQYDPFSCDNWGFPGPPIVPVFPRLHWASNVIAFNQSSETPMASALLGSDLIALRYAALDLGVLDGWTRLKLFDSGILPEESLIEQQRMRPDQAGGIWNGLPVIGFWAVSYTNGQLVPGVLSNYAAAYKHRGGNRYVLPQ
jgi:hypothetical protein